MIRKIINHLYDSKSKTVPLWLPLILTILGITLIVVFK